jgi:polar amino acid transport system ATP-binding protein
MNYTATDTILYLDKVSVGYKDKNDSTKVNMILKDITLEEKDIHREGHTATGQTIAFIGRSGRGKSTLFKALTGLLKPTNGKVLIKDDSITLQNSAKEVAEGDVGFVDQKSTLFRHKTLYQSCKYSLRKSKLSNTEKNIKIDTILVEWGLAEHKNKYPCELSGGSRQRAAIVMQMLTSKHFIVLDEPTSGLDYCAKEIVKSSMNKILNEDELNTIIFSTHDLPFAVEMADSIYIIGRPEPTVTHSTIIKHFDLKQMGIAWQPYGDAHRTLVNDIKTILLNS